MRKRILTTILLSTLLAGGVMSQTKVTNMTETMDFIPGDDQRRDFNNQLCALVKVQVLDDITEVEGNTMGDIVNRGVEKWVYMAQGSRNMKIHLKNNLPITVKFKDYNITSLSSNRVYLLIIDVPNQSTSTGNAEVKGNNLQARFYPPNATVTIWGDNMEKKTYRPQDDGTLTIFLPYGRYFYSAKANGYQDLDGNFFVNDENRWETMTMQPLMGTLTVNFETKDAELYLDGKMLSTSKNATSWTGQVPIGRHTVESVKKGYITKSVTVDVMANQSAMTRLEQLVSEKDVKKAEELRAKAVADSIAQVEAEKLAKEVEARRQEEMKIKAQQEEELAKKRQEKHEQTMKKLKEKESQPIVFGLTAGYNMATAQFGSNNSGSVGSQGGFHFGATAEFRLSDSFYVNTGLIYSAKGYTYEDKSKQIDETGKGSFVDIPIQASYRLPLGPTVKLQINAGPYAALCIGGNVKDNLENLYDESFSSAYSGFDYGLQVGAGLDIYHYFHIGLAYQFGMASKYSNRNLMIGVGVRF